MESQWKDWLAAERAAQRTGLVFSEKPIVRGEAYELALPIPGDLADDVFAAALFAGPDADNAPLVSFTVDVGDFDAEAGTTSVTLSLTAVQTDTEPPEDSNFDGLSEVIFKMTQTPSGGGDLRRILSLSIPVVE